MEARASLCGDELRRLDEDGYVVLRGVFGPAAVKEMTLCLERAFAAAAGQDASIRGDAGVVYAARNVLALWPGVDDAWRRSVLPDGLAGVLGPRFGLVRVLFFDKPLGQSWALPWHKDLTIAVLDNTLPSSQLTHPTRKAGVPHAEAPLAVLEAMLTARIHLDDTTEENGALKVIPGSHRAGKALALDAAPPRVVSVGRGDVLLIRPLVAHCSGKSHPQADRGRRVLHLEFAAAPELPDGYAWHDFLPGRRLCGERGLENPAPTAEKR
jgi:hypothetical protein